MVIGLGGVSFIAGVVLVGVGLLSALNGSEEGPPKSDSIQQVTITPSPPPGFNNGAWPSAAPTPAEPPLGNQAYRMRISKIGVDAPVEEYGLDENAVPVVPTGDNAASIVAWYNFSAKPGTGSNAVFAGHVTWFGTAVFYNLTSVAPGDIIELAGESSGKLEYEVTQVFSVNPTVDPNARDVMLSTPDDVLTIITCTGTFTGNPNDHVFGGDYNERLVVRAKLKNVTRASVAAVGG
jgi:LPXTG-site transpeptidase (sortase) family protein